MGGLLDWISVWYDGNPVFGFLINAFTILWLIVITVVWVRDRYCYRCVNLTIGSFKVARKDFTVQNVTNIVSFKFFDGGQVPGDIRKEILRITNPKVKDLVKNKNND